MLLPGRTPSAISGMADSLGVRMGDPTPDPDEPMVLMKMELGMTPDEIDASMRWRPGRAREVLVGLWGRDPGE